MGDGDRLRMEKRPRLGVPDLDLDLELEFDLGVRGGVALDVAVLVAEGEGEARRLVLRLSLVRRDLTSEGEEDRFWNIMGVAVRYTCSRKRRAIGSLLGHNAKKK